MDGGETLTAECVNAEVLVSDQRLPPSAVRTQIDQQGNGTARVRVQTQQSIDEPVVSILLRVGCVSPISRRFVVFADPPLIAVPTVPPLTAPAPIVLPLAGVGADGARSGDAQGTPARAATAQKESPVASPQPAAATRTVASKPARPSAGASAARSAAAPRPAATAVARAETPRAPPAGNASPAPAGPRLTLEPALVLPSVAPDAARAEADVVGQALQAVANAASAAQTAATAASASLDRMASLERTVAQLRSEAQANQALVVQLREKLDGAQGGSPWLWPLLLAALAGLSAWLSWRLGRVQGQRQQAWAQQQQLAEAPADVPSNMQGPESLVERHGRAATGPASFMSTDLPTFPPRSGLGSVQSAPSGHSVSPTGFVTQSMAAARTSPPAGPASAAAWSRAELPDITPLDTPMEPGMARTQPMAAPLRDGEAGVRDVSIDELIDLEQQAEFFVVLGQDEAAIDLLVDHLRSTGGGSPLPYLKLLEIYSRNNNRSAYERNRARFNHRFNAYAPEWGSDLAHGRSLEDYPGILPRLEQVWPRPLDAMAELEALLFRKSRGELFELPAYREVLFLYALARDLLDREAADTGSVDLLLPLSDGSAFGATAPVPFMNSEQGSDARLDADDRPTRPVDFDLTIPAQQTSMFDPMDEPPRPATSRRW